MVFKKPPLKALQRLAAEAGYADWQQARQQINDVLAALADFSDVAKALGVSPETTRLIQQQLNQQYQYLRAGLDA